MNKRRKALLLAWKCGAPIQHRSIRNGLPNAWHETTDVTHMFAYYVEYMFQHPNKFELRQKPRDENHTDQYL